MESGRIRAGASMGRANERAENEGAENAFVAIDNDQTAPTTHPKKEK